MKRPEIPTAICVRIADLAKPLVPSETRKCRICGEDIWTSHDTLQQTTKFECTRCATGMMDLARAPTSGKGH